jgi:hypothetical protein
MLRCSALGAASANMKLTRTSPTDGLGHPAAPRNSSKGLLPALVSPHARHASGRENTFPELRLCKLSLQVTLSSYPEVGHLRGGLTRCAKREGQPRVGYDARRYVGHAADVYNTGSCSFGCIHEESQPQNGTFGLIDEDGRVRCHAALVRGRSTPEDKRDDVRTPGAHSRRPGSCCSQGLARSQQGTGPTARAS